MKAGSQSNKDDLFFPTSILEYPESILSLSNLAIANESMS